MTNFLGKPALSKDQLAQLSNHFDFDNMKNNQAVSYSLIKTPDWMKKLGYINKQSLLRKDVVGSYKEQMSDSMIEKFDQWTEEKGIPELWKISGIK